MSAAGGPSVILQAYPDHVAPTGSQSCLQALTQFVTDLPAAAIDTLHLLPPYPATGDFGFAVIDYARIDPAYGDFADIAKLSAAVPLVLDFVVNHVSAQHPWFLGYLAGVPDYDDFFIRIDPGWDLTRLARPRTGQTFTTFTTATHGTVPLWTTYGPGQIDLNYRNLRVWTAVADHLHALVTRTGAGIRLDSIAFAYKEPPHRSIHTDGTYLLAEHLTTTVHTAAPGRWVIAEVDDDLPPHLDYRHRAGADAVYRYALPPLIAHALLTGNAERLTTWLTALPEHRWATGINITATHDGIYLRPHDPPLPADGTDILAHHARRHGGKAQTRNGAVYELNTTFGSLLQIDRHVAAHAIALTLPGVAQIYLPSLFAIPYDPALARAHADPRAGNRVKRLDTTALLADPHSPPARTYARMTQLLRCRAAHPETFHPHAPFDLLDLPTSLLGYTRGHGQNKITVVTNLTGTPQPLPDALGRHLDELTPPGGDTQPDTMGPYHVRWLQAAHRKGTS